MGLFQSKVKYDERLPGILFQTDNDVFFSYLNDGAFHKYYKPWKYRRLEIHNDRTLRIKQKSSNKVTIFDISSVALLKISLDEEKNDNNNNNIMCIKIKCTKEDLPTSCRFILKNSDVEKLCFAIEHTSLIHNINVFRSSTASIDTISDFNSNNIDNNNTPVSNNTKQRLTAIGNTIAKNLDNLEKVIIKQNILQRRGAFKYLPVLFHSDLIHGAWWYVIGSLFFTVSSAILLSKDFRSMVGYNKHIINEAQYAAEWTLLTISGLFFTIGSIAYVRAMSEIPMKPMCRCTHIRTDELLGSWMFFIGSTPYIPFSLIFAINEPNNIIYLGMFGITVFGVFATLLFVWTRYPSQLTTTIHKVRYFSCLLCLKCCFPIIIEKHCSTDLLIASWLVFIGTLFGTIGQSLYVLYYLFAAINDTFAITINIIWLLDFIWFLIGSAYFVAGSYPIVQDFANDGANEETMPTFLLDNDSHIHNHANPLLSSFSSSETIRL